MKMMIKPLGLVAIAVGGLFAAQAFATPCPTAPKTGTQTQGGPVCIAPVGLDGSGSGLQDQLNGMTTSGPHIDVYHDQASPSAYWSIGSTGQSENKVVLEIAGYANQNTFGIFDPSDPGNRLQLFTGNAGAGWSVSLSDLGGGNFKATLFDANADPVSTVGEHFGSGHVFGYYLEGPGGTFYSAASLNGGNAQMVAYEGNGQTKLKYNPAHVDGKFLSGEYLLAWEDLAWNASDLDYNDFVVLVESVQPVPEPAALGMFGLGTLLIGGFVALRRRQSLLA